MQTSITIERQSDTYTSIQRGTKVELPQRLSIRVHSCRTFLVAASAFSPGGKELFISGKRVIFDASQSYDRRRESAAAFEEEEEEEEKHQRRKSAER